MTATSDPSKRVYRTLNPATGEIVRQWDRTTDDEAAALLDRAHAAYLSWRDVPISQRIEVLRNMASLIDKKVDDIATQVSIEMGKPVGQSVYEIGIGAQMCRYYTEHGEDLLADEPVTVPGFSRAYTRRESMGVVLAIEPWNGPIYQAMRAAVPNIFLGNTILLKPSEISAGSTLMLDELFAEAGLPSYVYQTALLTVDQVSAHVGDPRVRAVTLTGSDRAGSAVAEQAGRHVKPIVLELGGSDAFIVLDSADPVQAAGLAASCRLATSGQICVSPKRVIVTESNADAFIRSYAEIFGAQKLGDAFDPETTLGPLSTEEAAIRLDEQMQDAIEKGATVVLEGGRTEGAFFKPALLTGITPGMRLYHEEAFGPLGMIYRVPDTESAIALANDTKYGLSGTVVGDEAEAEAVARRIDTGSVGINTWFGAPIEVPFGGTKSSGFGRELGRSGLDYFANIKTYGIA